MGLVTLEEGEGWKTCVAGGEAGYRGGVGVGWLGEGLEEVELFSVGVGAVEVGAG